MNFEFDIKFFQKILESIYEYSLKEQDIPLENIIINSNYNISAFYLVKINRNILRIV